MTHDPLSRRGFLVAIQLAAGGLALGLVPAPGLAAEPSGRVGEKPSHADPAEEKTAPGLNPNPLVHVGLDGVVTIVCARSEMGQGVRSSLPVLISDELGADFARVRIVQADGHPRYGDQNTDGSSSVRSFFDELRLAGATARVMLVAAAARRWKVAPASCTTRDSLVVHVPTGRTFGFGELSAEASKLPVPKPSKVALRPRAELAHLGGSPPLVDGPAVVTGAALFGADLRLADMLVAVIARPPVVGGKLVRFDATAALGVPGVRHVLAMPTPKAPFAFQPWGGVAVLADDTWAALRGREALVVEWDSGENATYDSATFRDVLLASVRAPGVPLRNVGDVDAALASAAQVIEAEYHVPHLAQMPMEPPAAIARVAGGRCEIWAPTQNPQAARTDVAKLLGIPEDDVVVHVTLLGGGFGRKSKADFVAEAAFLAREAGVPVRVQWTRTDDIQHGYYNTVNTQRLVAGLDAAGTVVAWHQRTAFPPIGATFGPQDVPGLDDLQQGVLDLALAAPNVRAEACAAEAHVRIGWYRSVYNIFHAFASGSFIDEIAHARGQDPRDTWLDVIGPARILSLQDLGVEKLTNYGASLETHPVDAGRLRHVIERVTQLSNWSQRVGAGRALGLAAHRSFLSYTGSVVSVVRDPRNKVRVDEAWIVMDAGTVVNADRVHAQLQGSVAMGISNALFGGITMKAGATQQTNFHDARFARIGDVPRQIHVEIVPSEGPPCGVGEPGVPPVGPAIANAVFALTGERVREMPLLPALRG
ncbi:MAG: molybdopterin cofactor-binding domain-containing protein [Myxococcota bacterium]